MAKATKESEPKVSTRPDLVTLAGLVIALTGIVGGLVLEKGDVKDILQATAAIIVFGGTFGAVMVTTPGAVLSRALGRLKSVFFQQSRPLGAVVQELIGYASQARRNGILSLEKEAEKIADPFLRKALNLAVDGTDLQELRKMMELEIALEEQGAEAEARVFEAAGGYAPTIGILGAVMGLIQVMKHLEDIKEVGHGIAVAFVATIYGVGAANLLFLPAGNKVKARAQEAIRAHELMLEGVLGIVEGLNPKLIEVKLSAYTAGEKPAKTKKRAAELAVPEI